MKHESRANLEGFFFGVITSTLTVLGVMFSIFMSGGTKMSVMGGIFGLALANSLADSFSIYVGSQAGGGQVDSARVAMITFVIELLLPVFYIASIMVFGLKHGVRINIAFGFLTIIASSLFMSHLRDDDAKETVGKLIIYVGITVLILLVTNYSESIVKMIT